MDKLKENNFAFIDGQNLYLSIKSLGWKIDYDKLRKYLNDKYKVSKAFMFLGYLASNEDLYTSLQKSGYLCVFKPTLVYKNGETKGNCDAELVLHTMLEIDNFDRAVLVTGDGDFHCLVKHLIKRDKLRKLLIPNQTSYSALLKRFSSEYLAFVSDLGKKIAYKKKRTQ
jgi:uncharacterized LabA/DUF88 family protein